MDTFSILELDLPDDILDKLYDLSNERGMDIEEFCLMIIIDKLVELEREKQD